MRLPIAASERFRPRSGLPAALLLAAALPVLGACREGTGESNFADAIPITPTPAGSHGCNGPNQAFMAPVQVYADPAIGTSSMIAAASGSELIFLSGSDGSVRELDFTLGTPPAERLLVTPGTMDALLMGIGINAAAEFTGIGILDANNLVVVENTSNSIWLVSRVVQDDVRPFVGLPSETPGFADGTGAQVRFSFDEPIAIAPSADGTIFVPDAGNHALRRVTVGIVPLTETPTGSGSPGYQDGELFISRFDTPVAVDVGCNGRVLIVEAGQGGSGGHRLRSAGIGSPGFFMGFNGNVDTLAGNGTDATVQGQGGSASLAVPRGIASSSVDEVYWVDSRTGILRRYSFTSGQVDCPLFADCATAVAMGGSFTNGGGFSLAVGDSGVLYVLDANAGILFQVSP